jgi:hypothetical protein
MLVPLLVAGLAKPHMTPTSDEYLPAWLVPNVTRWLPLVERWHPDFPNLDPALVLAVMAQESQGFHDVSSTDGHNSIGLMQVIPRIWTGTESQLRDPAYNIFVGMKILAYAQDEWGTEIGLAHYNCSEHGVKHDTCGEYGGMNYSEKVLSYWLPMFRAELAVLAGEEEGRIKDWLVELGYGTGLGRWDRIEQLLEHIRRHISQ